MKLTEAQVTQQCIDMLQAEGWEVRRQHVGLFYPADEVKKRLKAHDYNLRNWRPVTIGESGEPDWFVVRAQHCETQTVDTFAFFLEFKRTKGGRVSADQRLRHSLLRTLGFEVCVCRGLDELREWLGERRLMSQDRVRRLRFRYQETPWEGG